MSGFSIQAARTYVVNWQPVPQRYNESPFAQHMESFCFLFYFATKIKMLMQGQVRPPCLQLGTDLCAFSIPNDRLLGLSVTPHADSYYCVNKKEPYPNSRGVQWITVSGEYKRKYSNTKSPKKNGENGLLEVP